MLTAGHCVYNHDEATGTVRGWMDWTPAFQQKLDADCAFELMQVPFSGILGFYVQNPRQLIPMQTLNLFDPVVPPPAQTAARVMR